MRLLVTLLFWLNNYIYFPFVFLTTDDKLLKTRSDKNGVLKLRSQIFDAFAKSGDSWAVRTSDSIMC